MFPKNICFQNSDSLLITWEDGHESCYPFYDLRLACRCAECINEVTGEKVLKKENVSPYVYPTNLEYVGRYALGISFSDGHKTGIYTFDILRKLCPCCKGNS
ncbi:MAG TPA: hypothetical protein DDW49_00645 [Deltaproteobacteria bacterium]|nr:MAG: hypothetical protein A2048_06415 [Deltaproteobacteria bacterium GWA2_45_12]HBF11891.1 hypothetical protein [Deltaproteobacteria bacterium]